MYNIATWLGLHVIYLPAVVISMASIRAVPELALSLPPTLLLRSYPTDGPTNDLIPNSVRWGGERDWYSLLLIEWFKHTHRARWADFLSFRGRSSVHIRQVSCPVSAKYHEMSFTSLQGTVSMVYSQYGVQSVWCTVGQHDSNTKKGYCTSALIGGGYKIDQSILYIPLTTSKPNVALK